MTNNTNATTENTMTNNTTTENTMTNMNINTLFAAIVDTLATAVAAKIATPDVTLAVKEALASMDLTDVFDIDGHVQHAVRDMDLSDAFDIDSKVEDAVNDFDMSDAVQSALEDMDLREVFQIEDAVADHLDSCIDGKLSERLKTITDTLAVAAVGMDEARVRAIVREELRAVFMNMAWISDPIGAM